MKTEVAIPQSVSNQDLMELTGQAGNEFVALVHRMYVNRDPTDDDDNVLPVGHFAINTPNGATVFAKTVTFRPFVNGYQYRVYDSEKKEYAKTSIIFHKWTDEVYDDTGGLKCGKLSKKDMENVTDAVRKEQKVIRTYRLVYGTVSAEGVTTHGEKTTVDNLPVVFRMSGSNFMALNDIFEKISRRKHLFWSYTIKMSLSKQKAGATTYYVVVPELGDSGLKAGEAEYEALEVFRSVIDATNQKVIAKFKDARKSSHTDKNIIDITSTVVDIDLNDDPE